mgnify:CR=1 FL=1
MNSALWVAKTGLDAQQSRMSVVSNNLANVNTTGFKKGRASFEDLLFQHVKQVGAPTSQQTDSPTGLSLGTGVKVGATEKEFGQGNLQQTSNPLDVAINGRGFFQVLLPDGTAAYTRDGSFQVSATGDLVTANGFPVQPGINVVGQPTSSGTLRVAHRIVGTTEDHPLVRDLQLMIQSSRYITSRKEFERMVNASDPKAALDAFWLSCGNEKEASATLIATYYGRVEEANRYFSGVHPGWRTDRGMVHIVFGVPNKVRRGSDSEWWIYGEEGSANALVFRFLHVEHPWDSEFYVLSRSIQFRSPWDRMVTNWRNGRIKAD